MSLENEPQVYCDCVYCNCTLTEEEAFAPVPECEDNEGWDNLVKLHGHGCLWVCEMFGLKCGKNAKEQGVEYCQDAEPFPGDWEAFFSNILKVTEDDRASILEKKFADESDAFYNGYLFGLQA